MGCLSFAVALAPSVARGAFATRVLPGDAVPAARRRAVSPRVQVTRSNSPLHRRRDHERDAHFRGVSAVDHGDECDGGVGALPGDAGGGADPHARGQRDRCGGGGRGSACACCTWTWSTWPGVAPIIVYLADEDRVLTISGLGRWPQAASVAYFKERCGGQDSPGRLRCITPGSPDAWITALERYGTMSLAEVMGEPMRLAAEGFPMHPFMAANVREAAGVSSDGRAARPSSCPGGACPRRERSSSRRTARTMQRMVEAEAGARRRAARPGSGRARPLLSRATSRARSPRSTGREGGLADVRGPRGLPRRRSRSRCARASASTEIYTCGPWCQGPVLAQALTLLEGYDLAGARPQLARLTCTRDRGAQARVRGPRALLRRSGVRRRADARAAVAEYAAGRRRLIDAGRAPTPACRPPAIRVAATARRRPWSAAQPGGAGGRRDARHDLRVRRRSARQHLLATPSDGCLERADHAGHRASASRPAARSPGRSTGTRARSRRASARGSPRARPSCSRTAGRSCRSARRAATCSARPCCRSSSTSPCSAWRRRPPSRRRASRPTAIPGSFEPHEYHPDELRIERRLAAPGRRRAGRQGPQGGDVAGLDVEGGRRVRLTIDQATGVLAAGADPRRMGYAIGW